MDNHQEDSTQEDATQEDATQEDTCQKGEVETAGTIEVEIPAVVSPSGEVNASYTVSKQENGELEEVTNVGILYDHWWQREEVPLALIHIKASIDLDAVFSNRAVTGSVEVNQRD